jgi:hypothetical protein
MITLLKADCVKKVKIRYAVVYKHKGVLEGFYLRYFHWRLGNSLYRKNPYI